MKSLGRNIVALILIPASLLLSVPQHAQAQIAVVDIKNAIQSTVSAVQNTITAGATGALATKELTLDPLAYAITRKIIQSMVRSIILWINSGFQGSPAFVTDLPGFLLGVADEVAGDFIYGSELSFLCSPFQLDVRIALQTQYNDLSSGYEPQCTLTGVTENIQGFLEGTFSDGGWPAWFELTQGTTNDPTRAYYESQLAMQAAIVDAQGNAIKELDWGNGFLSFKICSDTQVQAGAETNCTITTPGTVIADQLNKALGAGTDSLITADEVNEIIGALLAQLMQQAVTGIYGILGMGGSSYTDYSYGASSTQSYADALAEEDTYFSTNGTSSLPTLNEITTQIQLENNFLNDQYEISARLAASQQNYTDYLVTANTNNCVLSAYPTDFTDQKTAADAQITSRENTVLPVLKELRTKLQNATSSSELYDSAVKYYTLKANGQLTTTSDKTDADATVQSLPDLITTFENTIDSQLRSCRNST